jgi:hypothetical protein
MATHTINPSWNDASSPQPSGFEGYDQVFKINGSPEGRLAGNPGALAIQPDGVGGALLWQKQTGTGVTGWVVKNFATDTTHFASLDASIVSLDTSVTNLDYSKPFNVKEYGAVADGVSDDSAALQAAITAAGSAGGGVVKVPAGDYLYSTTLSFPTNDVMFIGDGPDATYLHFAGSGEGITVTAARRVILEGFRLTATDASSNSSTHGICFEYHGPTTGWRYALRNVHVTAFTEGQGVRYTNCEQTETDGVNVYGCDVGFYFDNSNHTGSANGISNEWRRCRAQTCTSHGWHLLYLLHSSFDNCQALDCCTGSDGTTNPDAMMVRVRGTTRSLRLTNFDIETTDTGKYWGLILSGNNHIVENPFFYGLYRAFTTSVAANCTFLGFDYSTLSGVGVIDAGSSNVMFVARNITKATLSDSSTSTIYFTQGAAVADVGDGLLATTITQLNALLARLRTQGLIAT